MLCQLLLQLLDLLSHQAVSVSIREHMECPSGLDLQVLYV